jgi:SAM-dependent methyltransferase
MPSDAIDFRHRAELTELTEKIDEPCSRDQLRACLRDLARLNRWFLGYRPVLNWLSTVAPPSASEPLHIVDVGCGYGDTLRRIERWAGARGVVVELTGLDRNPDAVAVAAEATPSGSAIRWVAADVFRWQPEKPIHFVISSLFTHHLTEPDVIRFLQWMESTPNSAGSSTISPALRFPIIFSGSLPNLPAFTLLFSTTAPYPSLAPLFPGIGGECASAAGLHTTLGASIDARRCRNPAVLAGAPLRQPEKNPMTARPASPPAFRPNSGVHHLIELEMCPEEPHSVTMSNAWRAAPRSTASPARFRSLAGPPRATP